MQCNRRGRLQQLAIERRQNATRKNVIFEQQAHKLLRLLAITRSWSCCSPSRQCPCVRQSSPKTAAPRAVANTSRTRPKNKKTKKQTTNLSNDDRHRLNALHFLLGAQVLALQVALLFLDVVFLCGSDEKSAFNNEHENHRALAHLNAEKLEQFLELLDARVELRRCRLALGGLERRNHLRRTKNDARPTTKTQKSRSARTNERALERGVGAAAQHSARPTTKQQAHARRHACVASNSQSPPFPLLASAQALALVSSRSLPFRAEHSEHKRTKVREN